MFMLLEYLNFRGAKVVMGAPPKYPDYPYLYLNGNPQTYEYPLSYHLTRTIFTGIYDFPDGIDAVVLEMLKRMENYEEGLSKKITIYAVGEMQEYAKELAIKLNNQRTILNL